MKAIFIDGPLLGEFKTIPPTPVGGTFKIALPPRETTCICNDNANLPDITTTPSEIYTYYVIAAGDNIAFMSKHRSDAKAIKSACSFFIMTNLDKGEKLKYTCRDSRAFE
jgi:phenolic acid decarboxylase